MVRPGISAACAGVAQLPLFMLSAAAMSPPDSNPIVLIPARMASTRLPGKPLADIAGLPMIVQVWRRAMEADVGPVIVACAEAEIVAAVERAGGRAVLTRADHPSGSDRIFEALGTLDPRCRHDIVVNLQGDLPTLDPALVRGALAPLADPGCDIATLVAPIADAARARRSQRRQGRALPGRRCAASAGPSTSAARRCPGATARTGITSASMPTAAAPLSGSSRCRPASWSGASAWSSCGRWRTACASMPPSSPRCRSASTRLPTCERARDLLAPANG